MATIFMMLGGLLPTLILSRIALWIMRTWRGGLSRLATAHALSLMAAALLAGIGLADGGTFAGIAAIGIYAVPQAVWFAVDYLRLRGTHANAFGGDTDKPADSA